jgi:hypothetical protein
LSETTEEMALIILQLEGTLGIDKTVVYREFKVFIRYSYAAQMTHVYVTTAAVIRRIWQCK